MMRRLAIVACDLAGFALPPARARWHAAMVAEVACIRDDRDAMRFAAGCLVAGLRERIADDDSRFTAGLASLAVVSLLAALAHIGLAWRGAKLLVAGPDRFFALLQAANPDQPMSRAAFDAAMPVVAVCFLGLGIAHLCGGWLLLRRRLRHFAWAWGAGLVFAAIAVAVQLSVVWSLDGLPSEFTALLVQMLGLPALLVWSEARRTVTRN
jgi:hypothetical protein